MEMLTKSQGFSDDAPEVIKEFWRAIRGLPANDFINSTANRKARFRYDTANLNRLQAGYSQTEADSFLRIV